MEGSLPLEIIYSLYLLNRQKGIPRSHTCWSLVLLYLAGPPEYQPMPQGVKLDLEDLQLHTQILLPSE